jgi:hypothetical protein
MKEEIQKYVRNLFAEGKIKGFLALKQEGTDIGPHLFTKVDELGELSLGDRENPAEARYPLDKILTRLVSEHPNETFGVLVRGCDERALQLLFTVSMLDADHVIPVGFACPAELAEKHQCWKPFPDALVAGEPAQGVVVCWANSSNGLTPSTAVSSASAAGTFVQFAIATSVPLRKLH